MAARSGNRLLWHHGGIPGMTWTCPSSTGPDPYKIQTAKLLGLDSKVSEKSATGTISTAVVRRVEDKWWIRELSIQEDRVHHTHKTERSHCSNSPDFKRRNQSGHLTKKLSKDAYENNLGKMAGSCHRPDTLGLNPGSGFVTKFAPSCHRISCSGNPMNRMDTFFNFGFPPLLGDSSTSE